MPFVVEATPLPPPPVELAHPLIGGRYRLHGTLGEGAMGRVHRAYHRELGRAFALKVIAPALRDSPEARERFVAEARLASEMAHPNIVQVTDFGEDPVVGAFMVMELLEGTPLHRMAGPATTIARACEHLCQIALAVEHIHARGVVHGDLKPENMLLVTEPAVGRRRATVKLLDFGLARRISADDGASDTVAGSPDYLAPERITGAPAAVAADVYALGAVAMELITGAPPFQGALHEVLHAHLSAPVPALAARCSEPVDERLEALVARALAKDPQARHRTVAEFRYELQTVMTMLGIAHRRPARGSQQELALMHALDHSAIGQAVLTVERRVVAANPAFCKMLGVTADELAQLELTATTLGEAFPDLAGDLDQAMRERYPLERRAVVGDGDQRVQVVLWISRGRAPGEALHVVARVSR